MASDHRRIHSYVSRWIRLAGWGLAVLGVLLLLEFPNQPVNAEAPAGPNAPTVPILNTTTSKDFMLPGTQPHGIPLNNPLVSAQNCKNCHVDSITKNYAGSMMANSARDPLFRAALQVANQDANQGGELCIRCHVPTAWLDGRSAATDGSQIVAADLEGITCSVCHRLTPVTSADADNQRDLDELAFIKGPQSISLLLGSAAYIIDREDFRRGPYDSVAPHGVVKTDYIRSSKMCATCHEIDNPLLNFNEAISEFVLNPVDEPALVGTKLFPVERTYSEWYASDFNPETSPDGGVKEVSSIYPGIKRLTKTADGPVSVCQDCHMPMQYASIITGGSLREMGEHDWAGGSSVWQKGINQFWSGAANDASLDVVENMKGAQKGQEMLERAAELQLEVAGNKLTVTVVNNTGHKLPTGYAEGRRMWLKITALAGDNTVLYASGLPLDGGYIQDPVKVYEIKLGMSDIYASNINRPDLAGEGFHFILNNKVFKDNRIPPRGFTNAAYALKSMEPIAYSYDDGQYWDETDYILPFGTKKVEVTLYFQTASGEYLDFLQQEANVAVSDAVLPQPVNWGQVVGDLRQSLGLDAPVVMASASLSVDVVNTAPTFTSTPLLSATVGKLYPYNITATDPDLAFGDVISITATTKPAWLTFTANGGAATLSGTPASAHVGPHPVTLQVEDSAGHITLQSFTIVVSLEGVEPPAGSKIYFPAVNR